MSFTSRSAFLSSMAGILSLFIGSAANAAAVTLPTLPDALLLAGVDSVTTTPYTTTDGQSATTYGPTGGYEPFLPSGTNFAVTTDVGGVVTNTFVTTSNPATITVGGQGNVASLSVTGAPSPAISLVAISPQSFTSANSQADLDYYFQAHQEIEWMNLMGNVA